MIAMFKLETKADGKGLRCDGTGLFFAGEPLLERDDDGHFRPKPSAAIKGALSKSNLEDADLESRMRSVNVVAAALNNGEIARAMIAAVLMRLAGPEDDIGRVASDQALGKAGYNSAEPRDEDGQWTTGGASESPTANDTRDAFVEPFVEPLIGPLVEETPLEPEALPPGIDIVPPIFGVRPARPVGTPRFLRNPYPHRPECVEEWEHALRYCDKLRRKGKLKWDDSRRYPITYEQCVLGQVSEECGGNPVEYA